MLGFAIVISNVILAVTLAKKKKKEERLYSWTEDAEDQSGSFWKQLVNCLVTYKQ